MNDKRREAAIFELIVSAICFVFGGIFVSDAFLSYYSYESRVLGEWNPDWFRTIVGIAFVLIGALLMWEAERYRNH